MKERLNCPNCGAPITGTVCKYCGAVFYDFAVLDFGKPTYVRIKYKGMLNVFRAILTNLTLTTSAIAESTLDLSMQIVADDKGVYLYRKEIEQEDTP